MAHFEHMISTIDAHTGGEPVRIVVNGLPPISGRTMAEKKMHCKSHLDHFRTLLMQEPRGHNDMFGVILTPPCDDQAQYGILFIDNEGYLDMCGHSIIGAATVLIETGMVKAIEPETVIVFETPVGLVSSYAKVENHRVIEVSFVNVPSFVFAENVEINTPSFGVVRCDITFGGNFFATVDAQSLGLALTTANLPFLVPLGIEIRQAVNEAVKIKHPEHQHIDRVELTEFYELPDPCKAFSKSLVVFGARQFDRSPCGTGLSAAMSTFHAKGKLSLNSDFIFESIIGTRFHGRLIRTIDLQGYPAVEPRVTGSSYLTGIHQFVVDPDDALKYGFRIG
ncbi:MAG: proline racemase family protein [Methylococcaceae bacterium]|nr:proline racemase family protein [Methylococcaceae bacterium]